MLGNGVIRRTAYELQAMTHDYFIPDRSWEIAGWARLGRRYGQRIVEWMCNTGEVASGLARRGFDVIGVDLVPEMLAVAEQRAAGLPPELRPVWLQDDIRDAHLPRRENDLAIIAGDSFSRLVNRDDRVDALQTIRRYLRPGGALAMTLPLAQNESQQEQTGIYGPSRPTPPDLSVRKVVHSRYDQKSQLLNVHDRVEVTQDDNKRVFEYAFALRLFTTEEIVKILTHAGFASVGMFGDYDLKPWRSGAPEWIVYAERSMV